VRQAPIYVTGMGIVSALGADCRSTLMALLTRRSGVGQLRFLQTSHTEFPVGEVKLTNEAMMRYLDISENETTTRTSLMGMMAVREALQTAKLTTTAPDFKQKIALVSGTTVGGMDKSEQYYLDFLSNDTHNEYIATHDCGACTEMIADYFGIFSAVDTISTACSSAANAILKGAMLLREGRTDIAIAGGCECITKFHLNGFNTLMILDRELCRPFDATRAGLNLGEGAAYLVLETERTARERGIEPLCILSGFANTCDAYHQTASSPDGEGAYLAMTQALASAKLQPDDISYINAHGTGTLNNDLTEAHAISRVFGNRIPPFSSTKAFTGHTTSAAGSIEAVISILALQNGFIPVNLNFTTPMPELPITPATDEYARKPLRHVLTNSFGFGGNDTALIFSAP